MASADPPLSPDEGGAGDVAVPGDVFRAWREVIRGARSHPPPTLQWPPDDTKPLRWLDCDVSAAGVVFLEPRDADAVAQVVGGGPRLTQQELKGWVSLVTGEQDPRYIYSIVQDCRGGGEKASGYYMLPCRLPLCAALAALLGTAPRRVTDDDGRTVDINDTYLVWISGGGDGSLEVVQ